METVNCDNVQEKPTGPRPDHLLANSKNRTLSLCNNLHILEFYLNLTLKPYVLWKLFLIFHSTKRNTTLTNLFSRGDCFALRNRKIFKAASKKVSTILFSFHSSLVPFTSLCRCLCFLFYVEQFSHVFATLSTLKSSLPRFAFSVLRVLCAIVAVLAEREKLTLKVEVQIR